MNGVRGVLNLNENYPFLKSLKLVLVSNFLTTTFGPVLLSYFREKKNIAKMTFDITSHWAIFNPK